MRNQPFRSWGRGTCLWWVVGVLAAGIVAVADAAPAKDDLPATLTINSVRGEPGSTVYVNVLLETAGNNVATVLLGIAYDHTKLTLTDVLPGQIVEDADKTISRGFPTNGVVKIIIYGGLTTVEDGFLLAMELEILPGAGDVAIPLEESESSAATPGGLPIDVQVFPGRVLAGDAPSVAVGPASAEVCVGETLQLGADSMDGNDTVFTWSSSNTSVATVSDTGLVSGLAEGSTAITATGTTSGLSGETVVTVRPFILDAPATVSALQATESEGVLVQWDPVAGDDVEYRVYRSTVNDSVLAIPISAWQDETEFLDLSIPPDIAVGCFRLSEVVTISYYYWVRARTGNDYISEFSQVEAYAANKTPLDQNAVYEKVLPSARLGDSLRLAQPDSDLAVRLRSEEPLDTATLWAELSCDCNAAIWLPVAGDTATDGWVVFRPEADWTVGDVLTVTAGGRTDSGDPVGPIEYQFLITPPASGAEPMPLPQPTYADFDTSGLDLDSEAMDVARPVVAPTSALPALPGAVGKAVRIGPETVFEVPQRVWLPVPSGLAARALEVHYLHDAGGREAWYVADDVEGWLVPGSYLELELGGTLWLGFVVRHAGKVQLAAPVAGGGSSVYLFGSTADGPGGLSGDTLLLACVVVILGVTGLRRAGRLADRRPRYSFAD